MKLRLLEVTYSYITFIQLFIASQKGTGHINFWFDNDNNFRNQKCTYRLSFFCGWTPVLAICGRSNEVEAKLLVFKEDGVVSWHPDRVARLTLG